MPPLPPLSDRGVVPILNIDTCDGTFPNIFFFHVATHNYGKQRDLFQNCEIHDPSVDNEGQYHTQLKWIISLKTFTSGPQMIKIMKLFESFSLCTSIY